MLSDDQSRVFRMIVIDASKIERRDSVIKSAFILFHVRALSKQGSKESQCRHL